MAKVILGGFAHLHSAQYIPGANGLQYTAYPSKQKIRITMRTFYLVILQLILSGYSFGQSGIDRIVDEIEGNNTGLTAFRKQLEAREISYKTGNYLHNPELEYAWFKGSPGMIGNKINFSVMQSFDFPTAYMHRRGIAGDRTDQLELEFEKQRRELRLETRLLCLEVVFVNALSVENEKRLEHARTMVSVYEKMLDVGQANILELNKARLNFLNLQKEAEKTKIERVALLDQIASLNGGSAIVLDDTFFEEQEITTDFEKWYRLAEQNNPFLQWLGNEVEISRREEKLRLAMNLPSFSAGYVSEALTHEQFRGFAVGVSIPLWENKNTLKHARANTFALESFDIDQKIRFYNLFRTQHSKAMSLQSSVMEYRSLLQSVDSSGLLLKAWEQGEISLTNYLLELSFYYQAVDNILKTELELSQTLAILNQFVD
jgi:outer membrane protein, heavy metal efflux system